MSSSQADERALRAALVVRRSEALGQLAAQQRDFAALVAAAEASNADDEHDVEGASIAFERAQLAHALDRSRARLDEVDLALAALAEGRSGSCERCGLPIPAGRLEARPTARTCIACAGKA